MFSFWVVRRCLSHPGRMSLTDDNDGEVYVIEYGVGVYQFIDVL